MRTIIIYKSKTGFTERYANWLAEDLGCEAVPYKKRSGVDLKGHDTVIFMSSLHCGTLPGFDWLKEQLPALSGKRVAALAVGASPMESPELRQTLEHLFSGVPEVKNFYCCAGLSYERMGLVDKFLMAGLRAMLKKQPGQEEALKGVSSSFDIAKREDLDALAAWARG